MDARKVIIRADPSLPAPTRSVPCKIMRWVAKLVVARLLATAALWVRIQTCLKNTKWAT